MKRFTSLVLVFALIFAWAIPIGATAPTQGVAQFSNSYLPVLIEEAKGNGPDWLTRTDLQLRFDDLLNPRYAVETVQPLAILPSGVAFWQGRAATDGAGTEPTVNLGLGYRTVWSDLPAVAGVNAFYDHSFGKHFSRLGVGAEFFEGNLEGRFNAYFPLTGASEVSRTAADKTMEQAVRGWNFEVGGPLPHAPWAEVFAGGRALLNEHSEEDVSFQARAWMQITPHLSTEAGYVAKPDERYVKLAYSLGPSSRASLTGMKTANVRIPDVSGKLLVKVKRDNHVQTETWTEKITGGLTGHVYSNGSSLVIRSSSTAPTGYAAVDGATVSVQETSLSATTDSSGRFTLHDIPVGTITLVATFGALSVSGEVTVTEGTAARVPDIGSGTVGVLGGFVYRRDSVLIISDSPTPPGGFVPVEAGTVTIVGRDGTPITVTTDASGHFVAENVPAGEATITADDGAGNTAESTATVTADETVVPDAVGIVEGHVLTDGQNLIISRSPVAGYSAAGGVIVSIGSISATSDENGYFLLANVPAGPQALTATKTGLTSLSGTVEVAKNVTNTVPDMGVPNAHSYGNIQGYLFSYLSGVVMQASATPPTSSWVVAAGYQVTATPSNSTSVAVTATTDGSGRFVIQGVEAGPATVSFAWNTLPVSGTVTVPPNSTADAPYIGTGTVIGYVYKAGTSIVVRPTTSAPTGYTKVYGATVVIGGKSGKTDVRYGKFALSGVPCGTQPVTVTSSSVSLTGTVEVPVNASIAASVGEALGVGTVEGYVFTDGHNLIVRSENSPPPGYYPTTGILVRASVSATPDANGYFILSNVIEGSQTLTANKMDQTMTVSGQVTVVASQTVKSGDIGTANPYTADNLTHLGIVQGYAFSDGKNIILRSSSTPPSRFYPAVAGAVVQMASMTVTTDTAGYFRFINVPEGEQTVSASYSTYNASVSGTMPVAAITTNNVPDIGMANEYGFIDGDIESDGVGLLVRMYPLGATLPAGYSYVEGVVLTLGTMTTTSAGPGGYARFDKVPVGTYTLTVDAPWLENDTLTATVTITPNCEIIFPPMGTANPH